MDRNVTRTVITAVGARGAVSPRISRRPIGIKAKSPQQLSDSLRWWQKRLDELVASLRRHATERTADRVRRLKEELGSDAIPAIEIYPTTTSGGPRSSGGPSPGRKECFVAGTPVWTIKGPVEIERIRVGDLLLSQDPDTGELARKIPDRPRPPGN